MQHHPTPTLKRRSLLSDFSSGNAPSPSQTRYKLGHGNIRIGEVVLGVRDASHPRAKSRSDC